jgi:hypothetical protein
MKTKFIVEREAFFKKQNITKSKKKKKKKNEAIPNKFNIEG